MTLLPENLPTIRLCIATITTTARDMAAEVMVAADMDMVICICIVTEVKVMATGRDATA